MNYISMRGLRCANGLKARLLLADGTAVEGCGFGAIGIRVGELVFSTSMTGYTEALTDPSFAGQILIWTHPMVGCYGVPTTEHTSCGIPLNYESDKIHVEGFIVSELPPHNHYLSVSSLSDWLKSNGVPGMYRVDTRALVKRVRSTGVLMASLAVYREGDHISWEELRSSLKKAKSYDLIDFTDRVSPKNIVVHRPEGKPIARISILDCGLKYGILRWLLRLGFEVHRFPCSSKARDLIGDYDGVVLSNGPGNPAILRDKVKVVEEIVYSNKPVLGICLGLQLASIALGARTYKLTYGHRGPNKGVVDVVSGKSYITTQNHGFAIDENSLEGTGLKVWFKNIDDGSIEGLKHESLDLILVQFHPEGGPGPHDTTWIFSLFKKMVLKSGDNK
ncbi:MAG: glutamine-hydrolyzing carbamoyl-phosphate synthase small subunit [Acidilobaceae archaeon]